MFGRKRSLGPSPADGLRNLIFGDVPLDEWVPQADGEPGAPWSSFERARQLVHAGRQDEAVTIWRQVADTEGLETRHTLQAWHFLRQAGQQPPADRASSVLGAVAEMPMREAHDVLAAYRDGRARYLNYSGRVVIWEDTSDADAGAAIAKWLASAQVIAGVIGTWDKPARPSLPAGHMRLTALTPSGLRFGQGPAADLGREALAGTFISDATGLMRLLVSRAS